MGEKKGRSKGLPEDQVTVLTMGPVEGGGADTLSAMEESNTCYVIIPPSKPYDVFYEKVFSPAAKASGLAPVCCPDIYQIDAIREQVWRDLKKARVCVAEISRMDANVMFILGVASALAKPLLIFSQHLHKIPPDLRNVVHHIYNTAQPEWNLKLKSLVEQSIREVLENPAASMLFGTEQEARSRTEVQESLSFQTISSRDEFVMVVGPEAAFQCMRKILSRALKYCNDMPADAALSKINMISDLVIQEYTSDAFTGADVLTVSEAKVTRNIVKMVEDRVTTMLKCFSDKVRDQPEEDALELLKVAIEAANPERVYDEFD